LQLVFYLVWSTYPAGMTDNKCGINQSINQSINLRPANWDTLVADWIYATGVDSGVSKCGIAGWIAWNGMMDGGVSDFPEMPDQSAEEEESRGSRFASI
jgi:hypothetical protein